MNKIYTHAIAIALCCGLSNYAIASTYQISTKALISLTTNPIFGVDAGNEVSISYIVDNGISSLNSQTWTQKDIKSATFDFNHGALVVTFEAPFSNGLSAYDLDFQTNVNGEISRIGRFSDEQIERDYTISNNSLTPVSWSPLGGTFNFKQKNLPGIGYSIFIDNVPLASAANYSVSPISAVPEPSNAILTILGLVFLLATCRRLPIQSNPEQV